MVPLSCSVAFPRMITALLLEWFMEVSYKFDYRLRCVSLLLWLPWITAFEMICYVLRSIVADETVASPFGSVEFVNIF